MAGRPYGYEWTLELEGDPPWRHTTWAIFWLNSGELYATRSPRCEHDDRILLLGVIPYPKHYGHEDSFIDDLARGTIMRQRNSLVLAAETIVTEQEARAQAARAASLR